MNRSRLAIWILIVLVLATFAVSLSADFVSWDDPSLIYSNPLVNQPTAASLKTIWQSPHMLMYVPMTYTLWWVLGWLPHLREPGLFGNILNPFWYHLANVGIHAAGAVMVYAMMRRLLGSAKAGLVAAAFWAIHPMQVEAVAWATGMKDLLSGCLSIGAIACYVRCFSPIAQGAKPQWNGRWYVASAFVLGLATLAKPSTTAVPAMMLMIDGLWMRRDWRRALIAAIPMFLLVLPAALLAQRLQPASVTFDVAMAQRPLIARASLAFYIAKIFVPWRLCSDYGLTPGRMLGGIWNSISGAGLIAMVVMFVAAGGLRRVMAMGVVLLLVALLPVLGLVPFVFQVNSTVADRFAYLAILGPAFVVGWVVTRWQGRMATVVCIAGIGVLATLSVIQTRTWNNTLSLAEQTLRVNPQSTAARMQKVAFYMAVARNLRPVDATTSSADNQAATRDAARLVDMAREQLLEAIAIDPDHVSGKLALATIYQIQGNRPAGLAIWESAIDSMLRTPQGDDAWYDYYSIAREYLTDGNVNEARRLCSKMLAIYPSHPESVRMMARLTPIPATSPMQNLQPVVP